MVKEESKEWVKVEEAGGTLSPFEKMERQFEKVFGQLSGHHGLPNVEGITPPLTTLADMETEKDPQWEAGVKPAAIAAAVQKALL